MDEDENSSNNCEKGVYILTVTLCYSLDNQVTLIYFIVVNV